MINLVPVKGKYAIYDDELCIYLARKKGCCKRVKRKNLASGNVFWTKDSLDPEIILFDKPIAEKALKELKEMEDE